MDVHNFRTYVVISYGVCILKVNMVLNPSPNERPYLDQTARDRGSFWLRQAKKCAESHHSAHAQSIIGSFALSFKHSLVSSYSVYGQ